MPKYDKPPKRTFKCVECGRESTWQHWYIPADYRCICGGQLLELMKEGEDGQKREDVLL